jgi:hypothetical protein
MNLKEALKELEENRYLVMKRVINKDNGKVAVASDIILGIGYDEPREAMIEAERQGVYFNLGPTDEKVLHFLENRDCQVELLVGSDGKRWCMPLYMFKNMYKLEED